VPAFTFEMRIRVHVTGKNPSEKAIVDYIGFAALAAYNPVASPHLSRSFDGLNGHRRHALTCVD
jgi:hypothetical protein